MGNSINLNGLTDYYNSLMASTDYSYRSNRSGSAKQETVSAAFSETITRAGAKNPVQDENMKRGSIPSAVDDYVSRHPNSKYQIDRLLEPGKKFMETHGKTDAEIEAMSMEEYKKYIYDILDKIPFDPSQARDAQFIDITEDGWEQMKNDPEYEAWVVGYFKVDRSVKNPFAGYPGVEPRIHTEHFGASIDEHIGQSYPQSSSAGDEKDSEDWWKKRHKRHQMYLEEATELQEKRALEQKQRAHAAYQSLLVKSTQNVGSEIGAIGEIAMMIGVSDIQI